MSVSLDGEYAGLHDHRVRVLALSVAFWAWCALLSFPMIGLDVDLAEVSLTFTLSATALLTQTSGLVLFLAATFFAYASRILDSIGRLRAPQLAILAILFLSVALQVHDGEMQILVGIAYTCILMVTAVALSVLWSMPADDLERCLTGAAVILCSFGVAALVILGMPDGRSIGSIQPNLFATPLLAGFILSQFRPGIVGAIVRVFCFSMVAMVSSRFAVVGCVLAFAIFQLTFKLPSWRQLVLPMLALATGVLFSSEIAQVLALHDPDRGLSSGVSGRDELWQGAFATIAEYPFGLGFKRTIGAEGGHNGYLKILLEFGIVGGGLIIFFLACILVTACGEALLYRGKDRHEHRFACARLGGLVALACGAFFQPQLFNLGDAFGISLLLLLFRPRMITVSRRPLAS